MIERQRALFLREFLRYFYFPFERHASIIMAGAHAKA
jgi:hypothetical protein